MVAPRTKIPGLGMALGRRRRPEVKVEQGLTELRYKKSSCEDRRAENLKNPSL
jgi:hypothetical protein